MHPFPDMKPLENMWIIIKTTSDVYQKWKQYSCKEDIWEEIKTTPSNTEVKTVEKLLNKTNACYRLSRSQH